MCIVVLLVHVHRRWIEYKLSVPCYGCIVLNESMTKVILVKGWKATSSWGFPKGKINKGEVESDCAARYACMLLYTYTYTHTLSLSVDAEAPSEEGTRRASCDCSYVCQPSIT